MKVCTGKYLVRATKAQFILQSILQRQKASGDMKSTLSVAELQRKDNTSDSQMQLGAV